MSGLSSSAPSGDGRGGGSVLSATDWRHTEAGQTWIWLARVGVVCFHVQEQGLVQHLQRPACPRKDKE